MIDNNIWSTIALYVILLLNLVILKFSSFKIRRPDYIIFLKIIIIRVLFEKWLFINYELLQVLAPYLNIMRKDIDDSRTDAAI